MKNVRNQVSVIAQSTAKYPELAPYNPDSIYPELSRFLEPASTDESNVVYNSVRESFRLLGYDSANYGTVEWNPLGWLIHPGDTVFVKPNMIAEKHKLSDDWEYVITHGSIIRPMIDYSFLAMNGRGRIIIGDAPQTDSKFDEIVRLMGLREIQKLYKNFRDFDIEIINLQDEFWVFKDDVFVEKVDLSGDPGGSLPFDLGNGSYFHELDGQGKTYYGAFYDIEETNRHHTGGKHEYLVSRSPVRADVFISIPKLKTHKKCGLTVNLKSLVGINANKNWLPHYVFGSPDVGGDQFPAKDFKNRIENKLVVAAKKRLLKKNPLLQFVARKGKKIAYKIFGETEEVIRSGNWFGNDTVWRMALDLNLILMYGEADGHFRQAGERKRYFSVVDGIVSMEGNGPVAGVPKMTGVTIAGESPVAVDAVSAKLMGFDWEKIPLIKNAFTNKRFPLADFACDEIKVLSNVPSFDKNLPDILSSETFHFLPHFGWVGHIEEK